MYTFVIISKLIPDNYAVYSCPVCVIVQSAEVGLENSEVNQKVGLKNE